jgi:hypothetical protein
MQRGGALDLVGSNGGLDVLFYFRLSNEKVYRNTDVLALCHRLRGSSAATFSFSSLIPLRLVAISQTSIFYVLFL